MKTTGLLLLPVIASIALTAAESERFFIANETEFRKCVAAEAQIKKLAGEMMFTEGPAWHPDGFLVFSDIPANELKKWDPSEGVRTFRKPSHNANGNTIDRQGRLVSAEHSARRVSVTEKDGAARTLIDRHDGKKFNSPNDVVIKSDGTVWFTDPPYGTPKDQQKEQPGNYVFRFDPKANQTAVVSKDFDMPNGLVFAPDEKRLYVADSGRPRHIRVFEVSTENIVGEGKVFCKIDKGGPDGIRCDSEGRIWSSAGDGVHIFAPDGTLIGKILVPEAPANLCFGGQDGKTLFITARKSLYSIPVRVSAPRLR